MDVVITVFDNAVGETYPVYLSEAVRAHWGVSDPGHIEGTEQETIAAFEKTFATLELRVKKYAGTAFRNNARY
jgi:arsenate reductase